MSGRLYNSDVKFELDARTTRQQNAGRVKTYRMKALP